MTEIYNPAHNILELVAVLPKVSFEKSETERNYY